MKIDELGAKPSHIEQAHEQRFERLFREHWPRVYGVVFRLVGDPAESEDLALEAFWRLYQRRSRTSNAPGWLYRTASNLGLNALRARKRRRNYELQAGHDALDRASAPDPEAEAERAAARAAVRAVLARMKRRDARLLVMRHEGLAYAEIAAALGVAPGSVGTLLARAEREFERRFRALHGGEEE